MTKVKQLHEMSQQDNSQGISFADMQNMRLLCCFYGGSKAEHDKTLVSDLH